MIAMVDFWRLNHIKNVMRVDYDTYHGREVEGKADASMFLGAMKTILDLPVPKRDEPVAVSGEIDTERKTKMSYGNEYGNYGQDHYDRLNRTKEIGERDPFIGEGPHRLCVLSIIEYPHKEKGPTVRITFEVLQSKVHATGSRVTKLYFITKPAKWESQTNDGDRFADFVKKLKGVTDPNYPVGQDCRKLLKERVLEQLARGMIIDAMGVNTSKKQDKPFVEVYWTSVAQTQEQIGEQRRRVESIPGLIPQPGQPGPQQGPQQQQYAPPQGQQQYPQQQQYAPQNYAAAPQQPPQQNYAPPAQPGVVPQTQTAPQGGFLSQVPGFGGNPQGNGGQGGGW